MNHILLESQDEAVKKFFLSMTVDPLGSIVELDGRAVACVLPIATHNGTGDTTWTNEKNERRCDLIDREIDGALTPAEAIELQQLQSEMLRYRRRVAPLPVEDARKLHQELLAKAAASSHAK